MATTHGTITNNTPRLINVGAKKDWSGSATYPNNIGISENDKFAHQGNRANGSKGAVVYSGSNNAENCAWLVSWIVPGNGSTNKIYVEAGKEPNYRSDSIDWDTILVRLNASSSSSGYVDPTTRAEATAEITQGDNAQATIKFGVSR